jgi:hypothetical protein
MEPYANIVAANATPSKQQVRSPLHLLTPQLVRLIVPLLVSS